MDYGQAVLPRAAIAWACGQKRLIARGASCALCGKAGRACGCEPRELAEFKVRQGELPGVASHVAPAMPATPHGQGRLF